MCTIACSFRGSDVAQAAVLLERLADSGDVAVAEDAEHARQERRLRPVALDPLGGQERDQRLGRRQPAGSSLDRAERQPAHEVALHDRGRR